jgi:leucyl aminopeptidase (aminopeptidase T)
MAACGTTAPEPAASETAPPPAAAPAPSASAFDMNAVAERVVTQSAGIKAGDIVRISGSPRDLELLEGLAVNVRKVGGHPLITLTTQRMEKRMYTDVPAERDDEAPAAEMRLADIVTAVIAVDSAEDEGTFADVDPKRLAARANASLPLNEQFLKRNVKLIEIGNGLYPTEWRARRFSMTPEELQSTFWNGVNVDYNALQQKGTDVAAVVAGGREFHITSPSGTDLRVQRAGQSVFVSDGIISAEDVKKGGPNVAVYLPAGEVATTVVAGSATGKVVVPLQYFQGQEVQNLALTFEAGKLTSMTGSGPGFERLKAAYDASGPGKDVLGFVDLGINPNVRLGAESKLTTWVPAGTVTIGTGNNTWAGGDNNAAGGVTAFLSGCTVTLDGKTIVENGQLKL